jgi:membrane protease YdiL (CAAX protease family)
MTSPFLYIALVYPTALTLLYFIVLANAPTAIQQTVFGLGKVIQFSLPLFWWHLSGRDSSRRHWPTTRDFIWGFGSGGLIFVSAWLLYSQVLLPHGFFDDALNAIREKALGVGVGTPGRFISLALFYCTLHSGLEELYWRWFVFAGFRRQSTFPRAALISSLGFMAHHVCIVGKFFGLASPLTLPLSLAVAIGGGFWAWRYEKTEALYEPWFSHLLVDAAIFAIGFQLLFRPVMS